MSVIFNQLTALNRTSILQMSANEYIVDGRRRERARGYAPNLIAMGGQYSPRGEHARAVVEKILLGLSDVLLKARRN